MAKFEIEVTDTFAGEANYSWVRRYNVKAKSARGAMTALARKHGGGWRKAYDIPSESVIARYDLRGACVCAFVSYSD